MQIAKPHSEVILSPGIIAAAFVAVGTALIGHFYLQTVKDQTGFSWVWILSVLQVMPFLLGIVLKSQNYLNFILLSHFAGFSLSKWNEAQYLSKTHSLSISWVNATHELTICTLLLASTYYISRIIIIPEALRKRPFNDLTLSPRHLRFIFAYVCMIPFMGKILPYALLIIHFALSSAQMLLLICAQAPNDRKFLRLAQASLPLIALCNFILSGFLTMFGQYASFLIVYGFTVGKYKLLVSIVVLVFFVSAIQSVKNDYRTFRPVAGSFLEQAQFLYYLLDQRFVHGEVKEETDQGEEDRDIEISLIKGFSRVGDDSLERVLAMTPSVVPFWEGETYQSIPYMFIPRVLWPDKPGRHFWNKFGRAYHVLSEDDIQTSVGVGFFAEAYMNFGFGWMYLLAAIMGVFVVVVERLSMSLLHDKFYFTYIAFLGPIIGLGTDLGSLVNSTAILSCCMFMARPFLLRLAQRDDYS